MNGSGGNRGVAGGDGDLIESTHHIANGVNALHIGGAMGVDGNGAIRRQRDAQLARQRSAGQKAQTR